MFDLIRTISDRNFKTLYGIAQISAHMMFHVQDFVDLARAVQDCPEALKDPDILKASKVLERNFVTFMLNNNALVQGLMNIGVLTQRKPDLDPETPPTPPKPIFTIVK
jgi:hypothetical protein